MTDEHKKQKTTDANTINIVAAGIAGVIAGGAAVAATVLMSDKNNQKKGKRSTDRCQGKSHEIHGHR